MKQNSAPSAIFAAIADVVLVAAFVLIGRASHGEGVLGTLLTLWPFVAGLAVGWIGARAWRSPIRLRWTGLTIWVATVVVGLLLRAASGQGVQFGFVIVTSIVLAGFLLGWRALAGLLMRRVARRA